MKRDNTIDDLNLEKDAPLLHSIGKNNPFKVPDGYFDALPAQVLAAAKGKAKHTTEAVADKIFWLFRPQWMLASFILICGLGLFLRKGNNTPLNYEAIAANLPDSVIMQHLQSNIDYVDVSTLEEMAQAQGGLNAAQPAAQDSTNGQIINYLINNNVDAADIENAL
jgi:hypothetical protein